MTVFQVAGVMVGEFVFGVAVGVVFKDRIVAGVLNVTNFPAKAWAGFKAAIGVKVKSVESEIHDDLIALQAKVDKAFGKGQTITIQPGNAITAPAPVAPAAVSDAPATPAA